MLARGGKFASVNLPYPNKIHSLELESNRNASDFQHQKGFARDEDAWLGTRFAQVEEARIYR